MQTTLVEETSRTCYLQFDRTPTNRVTYRSNSLACGPFESKMMAATLETYREQIEGNIPLGRIGTPQDVAGACLFLSSRAGSYVNGATITLDGGSAIAAKL